MSRRAVWRCAGLLVLLCASFAVDRPVARVMAGIGPAALRLLDFITWFGQGGVILYPAAAIVLAAAACGFAPGLRERAQKIAGYAASIFLVVAAAGLVNDALKICFGRARPRLWLAGDESGFHFLRYGAKFASFPSGHTATSTAAAVILGALFPPARRAFAALAVLIGCSRVALDAHYVSDVIAGALVGGAVALKTLDLIRKWRWTPTGIKLGNDTRDDNAAASASPRDKQGALYRQQD